MLSTPVLGGLPESFKTFFGRSADLLLTGHFYTQTLTPVSVSGDSQESQTFTIVGLRATDVLTINTTNEVYGVILVAYRVSATDTLELSFENFTAVAKTPASKEYKIVAIRRERE